MKKVATFDEKNIMNIDSYPTEHFRNGRMLICRSLREDKIWHFTLR